MKELAGDVEGAALVSIEEVALRLGVSVRHIRRLVAERRIPFVKWGHLLRFDPVQVESWIEDRSVPAGVDRPRGRN